MIKVIIGTIICIGVSLNGSSVYNTNMDKKEYYSVDTENKERYKTMSKILDQFITSQASDKLIREYKNGILKLSEEELELERENKENEKEKEKSLKKSKVVKNATK